MYTVEFRAQVSGQLQVHIWLNGKLLPRCPYSAEAVTLRPEPSMCVLRGESLRSAVARKPQAFDIDFVSALGHVAYAEELDVRVERIQQLTTASSPTARAGGTSAATGSNADVAAAASEEEEAEAAAREERLAVSGTLRVHLRKAIGSGFSGSQREE